ncbi:2,3-dihydroxybenzoate-AMP ligase [Glutamicibacter uratoxydans]|uniref:2,3-dihydroxybenzoate-AMP ligase n=1 Tax=Glutamicibacter uratoxydans TaxID=43667 RepID=A0A4Y4DM40_GLUUR|nr:AMP-binding protein [Glutamicibacter uratoxydans]GED04904.1 2,3-dihydroxybenzoate-AMP ligase [Glutamicibacter uratoxydans]
MNHQPLAAADPLLAGVKPYPAEFAERYIAAGYWAERTLDQILRETAVRRAGHPAVIDRGRRVSYAELVNRIDVSQTALSACGIAQGERVIIHVPNVLEFFDAVYAVISIGAIPVFAVHSHRASELEHLANSSGAVLLLTSRQIPAADPQAIASQLASRLPGLRVMYAEDLYERGLHLACSGWDVPRQGCPRPAHAAAFLQLSGGTTGKPKLIPKTHRDYAYSFERSAQICALGDHTVYLSGIPLAHNFAASSPGYMGVFATGGTVVCALDGSAERVFELIAEHRVTMVAAVPPLAQAWLNSNVKHQYDLSSWKLLQVGGAKLARAVAVRVEQELGCTLQQVFGMAEGLVCYTRLDDDLETIASTQGKPMSDADEVLVLDAQGNPVPEGTPGNLWVRGPYTFRGYYNNPEANAASFTPDGFYGSGDIVVRDARGYLSVVGRTKDVINRGGEKVSPEQIEAVLLRHPAVHDASVIGVPDELLGERTHAYVVPREISPPPRAKTLRAWMRGEHIADHHIPDMITVVESLPTTHIGKISRNTLGSKAAELQGES